MDLIYEWINRDELSQKDKTHLVISVRTAHENNLSSIAQNLLTIKLPPPLSNSKPMSQNKIDIDYIAELARISLTAEEKQNYGAQLADILKHIDAIQAVDVSSVDATAHALPIYNVWQKDTPGPTFTPEEALLNSPEKRDNQIVVPQVVDTE
jgi:aspartyl-tRNA(Asn)/glutamyl-tRNA(Gln) amidotransferase subunit C